MSTDKQDEPDQPALHSVGRSIADDIVIFALSREPNRRLLLSEITARLNELTADPEKAVMEHMKVSPRFSGDSYILTSNVRCEFIARLEYLKWQAKNSEKQP